MKQTNVRKTVILICLFGIVVCLLLFLPQIRQFIIKMTEQLILGRELMSHRYGNSVLLLLAIYGCVFFAALFFVNYKYKINYSERFFHMTDGLLYSGETEISGIETGKIITSTLINKLKNNSWLIFSICIVFFIILVFFTTAHPVVPYGLDDWFCLGSFRHPVPLALAWNPSRVFPEVFAPLAGLFAAHIVNPVLGDYLTSISFTVALIMAGFTTILYWSLYRLFLTLSGNKIVSILSGLIVLCLYFSFFKTQKEGSQYMLHATRLNTYFYYLIPNLLNSICVCLLMHYTVCGTRISVKELGGKTFSIFAIALYFAIFSMLFAVIILAVYCFWELLITAIHKEKLTKKGILVIILIGFFVYASIEFIGDRAEATKVQTYYYSFFSLGYWRNCKEAFMYLLKLIGQIHKGLLFLTMSINIFAMILLGFSKANDKNKPLVKTGIICLLSFVSLVPTMIIITGKTSYITTGYIENMYGIFFYYILFSVLSLVYLLTKLRKRAVLPFFLAFIFLETTNTDKPYSDQVHPFSEYPDYEITTQQRIDTVNKWIEQVKLADKNQDESIIIYVPDSSNPSVHNSLMFFSNTLYAHGITSRKIAIVVQTDPKMTENNFYP